MTQLSQKYTIKAVNNLFCNKRLKAFAIHYIDRYRLQTSTIAATSYLNYEYKYK